MSLGSCLVANEPGGMAEAFIQARVDGKSWQQIAEEFDLPNPGAARKAFEKATGISDFKIKGQALQDLVNQGPNALKAVNEAKAAAKKVKALDDVVPKPSKGTFGPPKKPPDLSPDLDWPEPSKQTVKQKLNMNVGYTDEQFEKILKDYLDGVPKMDILDEWALKNSEFNDLINVWAEEGKLGNAKEVIAKKFHYSDADFDKMFQQYATQGKHLDEIADYWSLSKKELDNLVDFWKAEGKLGGPALPKKLPDMEEALGELDKLKTKLTKKYEGTGADLDEIEDIINGTINDIQKGKLTPDQISELNGVTLEDIDAIKSALKWDDLKAAVQHVDTMSPAIQQQLYHDLVKFAEDQEYALTYARNQAKQKYLKYLDDYEGTDLYDGKAVEKLLEAHKRASDALKEFVGGPLEALNDDIAKVMKAIEKKPAAVPDIPVNQPVKSKFTSDVNVAQKTGLTPTQVQEIIDMNGNGQGYFAIKDKLGIEFAQIDDVIWNELLKKHNGFTWRAYTEKPTSESGFEAVKAKVFEARSKGLTVKEIASKPGAPPETVIQAIINDKWKLPSAGTKVPIIPPPPPPPPQVFGGTIPSTTGIDFRRHGNEEMLDWIRPDTAMLPSAQRKAISNYTNSGYHDINSYLRGQGLTDTQGYGYTGSNVSKLVTDLDKTMRPLPVDTVVTRNFNGIQHLPAAPEDMVGLVYSDNAFLSTSVKEAGVFSGDVQLVINCPQGTMGRYVNDISIHTNEEELLLARGTKMVVTKVEKVAHHGGFRYRLFCEVIPG